MLFLTNYTLVGDRTAEKSKALLALFIERGSGPGEIAHYIRVDGSGGTLISDNANYAELHDQALAYGPYMDFDIVPIRTVEEAVPELLKHYG